MSSANNQAQSERGAAALFCYLTPASSIMPANEI